MTETDLVGLQEGEQTPEQREMALVKLWEKGLDTIDCVAYHHTTLEAIQYLIENGGIPGQTEPQFENPNLPQVGDVYFTPRGLTFPFDRLPGLWEEESNEYFYPSSAQKVETSDALPVSHRLCSVLGLNIGVYGLTALNYAEDTNGVRYMDFFEAEEVFRNIGLTDKELTAALEIATPRKGILVGLTLRALDGFPLSRGDAGYDIRLSTGSNGLYASAFSGIKPLGEEESAFLQGLKHKYTLY